MLKFTCSYNCLIFDKLPGKKSPCENEIQYDTNFTLYLDSLPLRIKATPTFHFTTENDVRSHNPLAPPHKFNYYFFFLKDVPPVPILHMLYQWHTLMHNRHA